MLWIFLRMDYSMCRAAWAYLQMKSFKFWFNCLISLKQNFLTLSILLLCSESVGGGGLSQSWKSSLLIHICERFSKFRIVNVCARCPKSEQSPCYDHRKRPRIFSHVYWLFAFPLRFPLLDFYNRVESSLESALLFYFNFLVFFKLYASEYSI